MSARKDRCDSWWSPHYPVAGSFLSNDGKGSMRVPGFGSPRLPVDVELVAEDRFAHGFGDWAQPRLTAREVAMLQLMNDLTDRPGWDEAVFDAAMAAKWRDEACSTRALIDDATWDWCLAELRDAAPAFRQRGYVDVLNSASGICKSDGVVSSEALDTLRAGIDAIISEQDAASSPSSRGLQMGCRDIVDPTLFPLAYGATCGVLTDYGQVPLADIFSADGRFMPPPPAQPVQGRPNTPPAKEDGRRWWTAEDAQRYCWSPDFQLLPCEVQFAPNGRVAISSYINNLHPRRHAAVYGAIETVMAAAIPLWNRVLVKRDADRLPLRIRTYGPVIEPAHGPAWLDHARNLGPSNQGEYQAALPLIEEYLAQPEPPAADRLPTSNGQDPEPIPDWSLFNSNFYGFVVRKLDRLRHTVHPQPGVSYTYEDWKAGRANRAIVPGRYWPNANNPHHVGAKLGPPHAETHQVLILEHPDHPFPVPVDLAASFAAKGLQIIVKLTRTTLTPGEKSRCEAEPWHVDGMLNEHLVAGAALVLDSHNVTTPALDFRVEAELDPWDCGYPGPTELRALEITFGFGDSPGALATSAPAVQELGSVKFLDNQRLIAYPHGTQRRMGVIELVDTSAPGHFDVLELWLVDPHYRICSTRNVPPQRHDWWFEAVLQSDSGERLQWPRQLPNELINKIDEYTADFPVSMDEAQRWRGKRREQQELCQEAADCCVDGYMFLEQWRR